MDDSWIINELKASAALLNKYKVVAVGGVVLAVLLLAALSFFSSQQPTSPVATPTPTPAPSSPDGKVYVDPIGDILANNWGVFLLSIPVAWALLRTTRGGRRFLRGM